MSGSTILLYTRSTVWSVSYTEAAFVPFIPWVLFEPNVYHMVVCCALLSYLKVLVGASARTSSSINLVRQSSTPGTATQNPQTIVTSDLRCRSRSTAPLLLPGRLSASRMVTPYWFAFPLPRGNRRQDFFRVPPFDPVGRSYFHKGIFLPSALRPTPCQTPLASLH